jgi:lipoprotein-anchoring transpeptidase ErfK/SrfK
LTNENGHVTVFAIQRVVKDGCSRLWYDVALPMRPNGTTGYVAARDVDVLQVHTRIVVDLSERHLTYFKYGEPELDATVAVGAPSTPTPTGHYYVNQRLIAPYPSGPWGPAAIGISAFSDVLQEWSQGGPIGIHGTNEPDSIGRAVSHGCIRLPNATLLKLFAITPAGTPVIIHP